MRGPLLVVSPHLDDAVLSVGASLAAVAETGRQVVVCTVFSGDPQPPLSPVAHAFHADCGLGDDAAAVRRREDSAAAAVLRVRAVHLEFRDAIYRRNGDEWLCRHDRAMFDPDLPADPQLATGIVERLGDVIARYGAEEVWTCAAIGGHVDHGIVLEAVVAAAGSHGQLPVALWEDLPYAIGTDPAPGAVTSAPATLPAVEARHVRRKLAATACYPSQLRMLWPDQDWRTELTEHTRRRRLSGGAELIWRREHYGVEKWTRSTVICSTSTGTS